VIAVIDYRAGNLASVVKALASVGADARLVRSSDEAAGAKAVVVPGVGHFNATAAIDARWRALLAGQVRQGRPLLGICLGMQWLFESSEEAPGCPGLGVLPGSCRRLAHSTEGQPRIKIPHVGWNALDVLRRPSRALDGVADGAFVYFTHSYAAPLGDATVAATSHGSRFTAVIEAGPVWGTQFHPEKSGEVGLRILKNFVDYVGAGN
jgi:imidazole glycerol-phosphate synthase subunit HisH